MFSRLPGDPKHLLLEVRSWIPRESLRRSPLPSRLLPGPMLCCRATQGSAGPALGSLSPGECFRTEYLKSRKNICKTTASLLYMAVLFRLYLVIFRGGLHLHLLSCHVALHVPFEEDNLREKFYLSLYSWKLHPCFLLFSFEFFFFKKFIY